MGRTVITANIRKGEGGTRGHEPQEGPVRKRRYRDFTGAPRRTCLRDEDEDHEAIGERAQAVAPEKEPEIPVDQESPGHHSRRETQVDREAESGETELALLGGHEVRDDGGGGGLEEIGQETEAQEKGHEGMEVWSEAEADREQARAEQAEQHGGAASEAVGGLAAREDRHERAEAVGGHREAGLERREMEVPHQHEGEVGDDVCPGLVDESAGDEDLDRTGKGSQPGPGGEHREGSLARPCVMNRALRGRELLRRLQSSRPHRNHAVSLPAACLRRPAASAAARDTRLRAPARLRASGPRGPSFRAVVSEILRGARGGEPADRLFLIEAGEAEVSIRTPEGRAPVCRLSEGEMFGEIGLLLPSHRRTARVTATQPLFTSTLRGRHLNEVLDQYPEAREVLVEAADQALVRSFIKCTRPFERLTPERLQHLGPRLSTLEFGAGTTIFRQGDPGDVCYLVRSGSVEVVREDAAGSRVAAVLERGDIVGESALLTSTPRDATLRARERSQLLALKRTDLIETLDQDKRVANHMVELLRQRDRPLANSGVLLQPRPTATGETIWVLADSGRLGVFHQLSSLGLFVWNRLDGAHNVEEVAARHRAERGPVEEEEIARIMAELVQGGFATARSLDPEVTRAAGPRLPWWRKWWRTMTQAKAPRP
jgi:CRP-like cAMP-binding protein